MNAPVNVEAWSGKDRGDIVVQTKEQFIAGLEQVGRAINGPLKEA